MKALFFLPFFLTWLLPGVLAQTSMHDSISVTILLKNRNIIVDSVYIIFDRYDLSGAGVIKKVFYPSDNQIIIEKVPKGKYYVEVYCIGVDRQNFSRVSTIGKRRSNKVTFPLKNYEVYIPGAAIIPSSHIDLGNLIVTRRNFHK